MIQIHPSILETRLIPFRFILKKPKLEFPELESSIKRPSLQTHNSQSYSILQCPDLGQWAFILKSFFHTSDSSIRKRADEDRGVEGSKARHERRINEVT